MIERTEKAGWAVASSDDNTVTVAFDTTLTDELRLEARVLDVIHTVNGLRKDTGLELSDRITLTLPTSDADLLPFADWIQAETLAVALTADGDEVRLAKV